MAEASLYFVPSLSYQSVFWPVAGFALFVVLLRGPKMLISILLSGVIIYSGYNDLQDDLLLRVTVMVLPALQAGLGWYLIRKNCGKDLWVLDDTRGLIRWIIAGSLLPACCSGLLLGLVATTHHGLSFRQGLV